MARTYTISGSIYTGRTNSHEGGWTNFDSTHITQSDYAGYVGKSDSWYYATNIIFDSATLDPLRSKTISTVTLQLTITKAVDAPGLIAWKLNSTQSGNSNSEAWGRSDNAGTSGAGDTTIATNANPSFDANTLTVGTKTFTLKALPQYGLVAGPYNSSRNGYWIFSTPILYVTTTESLTLSYNANGGSGAPSSSTHDGNPNYTFTIDSTRPTRAGYSFLGWSESSTATTASYQPGGTITLDSNTTLYAIWKRANTVRIANGSSLDTYLVYVVESNNLVPYRVTVANGSSLDVYT